jgi:hypothetical protein
VFKKYEGFFPNPTIPLINRMDRVIQLLEHLAGP